MPSIPWVPRGCPVTLGLIAINLLLFGAQFASSDRITDWGLLYGPYVQQGQWWRLFTSAFLHGSLLQVGFNLYLLILLGPGLERSYGRIYFALMYLASLAGGSLGVMLFAWDQPTLGASGAILGLAAAMGMAFYARGINPSQSPAFGLMALNLAIPLLVPGISLWGHLGGASAGLLIAYLIIWLPARSQRISASNTISFSMAAVALTTALSMMAALKGGVKMF